MSNKKKSNTKAAQTARPAVASSTSTNTGSLAQQPAIHQKSAATSLAASHVENKSASTGRAMSTQAVAEAAYYLWLQRGGSDVANWLEAEQLVQRATKR